MVKLILVSSEFLLPTMNTVQSYLARHPVSPSRLVKSEWWVIPKQNWSASLHLFQSMMEQLIKTMGANEKISNRKNNISLHQQKPLRARRKQNQTWHKTRILLQFFPSNSITFVIQIKLEHKYFFVDDRNRIHSHHQFPLRHWNWHQVLERKHQYQHRVQHLYHQGQILRQSRNQLRTQRNMDPLGILVLHLLQFRNQGMGSIDNLQHLKEGWQKALWVTFLEDG